MALKLSPLVLYIYTFLSSGPDDHNAWQISQLHKKSIIDTSLNARTRWGTQSVEAEFTENMISQMERAVYVPSEENVIW